MLAVVRRRRRSQVEHRTVCARTHGWQTTDASVHVPSMVDITRFSERTRRSGTPSLVGKEKKQTVDLG
jgi:hypothetical protein